MKSRGKKRHDTVKDRITKAFLELLDNRSYHEITIVDIVEAAQSGRVSFYRNFRDKDDVLRYYIFRETDKWMNKTKDSYVLPTQENIKPYIIWLLDHMYEYRFFIDMLKANGKLYLIEEEFDRRFFKRLSEMDSPLEIAYTVGGLYKLFEFWAENGYKETPREVAEIVGNTSGSACDDI